MSRSNVKVTGDKKTTKCAILFGSRPLGHSPSPVLCRWENQLMQSSFQNFSIWTWVSQLSLILNGDSCTSLGLPDALLVEYQLERHH